MRVLVTRPERQAEATAQRLAILGHRAYVAPVLEIAPTAAPMPQGAFDLLLATSASAFTWARLPAHILQLPLACVGQKTADAGRDLGFSIFCIAPDSHALVNKLAGENKAKSTLYLAGRDRKADLEELLREKGWRVAVCETYEARAVSAWPNHIRAALERREIEAVLHYSPRSAALALRLMGREAAKSLFHFCLSADVASACKDWAPPAGIVASSHPDEDALMTLLRSREAGLGDEQA
jgi:uroporphyrinogen-III synthase